MKTEYQVKKIQLEKRKARKIRDSQWWKNRRAKNICFYCQESFHARLLTMDHVIPLTKGGLSVKSNLVPCCKSCNSKKKNLLPTEWTEFIDKIKRK